MPIRNNSRINKLAILDCLFHYGEALVWRKKIIGYGLNESDFPNYKGALSKITRKVFRTYYKDLLRSQLIVKIKTTSKRGKCYMITPLGIVYLFSNHVPYQLSVTGMHLHRMELILNCFIGTKNTKTHLFRFDRTVLPTSFLLIRYLVDTSVKVPILISDTVRYDEDFNVINLYVNFAMCIFNTTTLILQGEIYVIHEHNIKHEENYDDELDADEFHSYLAHYLIYAITYQVMYLEYDSYLRKKISYLDRFRLSKEYSQKKELYDQVIIEVNRFNNYFIEQTCILNKNLIDFKYRLSNPLEIKTSN